MFRKSIIALTVATIAIGNISEFGSFRWQPHNISADGKITTTTRHSFAIKGTNPALLPLQAATNIKSSTKHTHKKIWWKKYKACLILKY